MWDVQFGWLLCSATVQQGCDEPHPCLRFPPKSKSGCSELSAAECLLWQLLVLIWGESLIISALTERPLRRSQSKTPVSVLHLRSTASYLQLLCPVMFQMCGCEKSGAGPCCSLFSSLFQTFLTSFLPLTCFAPLTDSSFLNKSNYKCSKIINFIQGSLCFWQSRFTFH